MWTPLLVSVDFIRIKKERSRVLSGDRRLGLLDSTAETNNKHPVTTPKQYTTHRDAEISDCFSECDVQHHLIEFLSSLGRQLMKQHNLIRGKVLIKL